MAPGFYIQNLPMTNITQLFRKVTKMFGLLWTGKLQRKSPRWLPGLGSNQGLQLQRLTCYHYTTGQNARITFLYLGKGLAAKGGLRCSYSDPALLCSQGPALSLPVI